MSTTIYNGGASENLDIAFRSIPGNTWAAKLSSCLRCECCARHTESRPVSLETWVEPPLHPTDDSVGTCECPCRHNARFICRQVSYPPRPCPINSPRVVTDVLTPGERIAWLEHLDQQEIEAAISVLSTN